ncbi:MAG TPA: helix-turn-helix transcriptional regulator [Cytophagaceae bacterium]|jgi:hypothetical protein|nr:helix-turn-helix transcriptional regulator [Cytophagaceae bacterium]
MGKKVAIKKSIKDKDILDPRITNVGKRLRELRTKKGYTSFEKFAFDNDLSRVGYGEHEKGKNMTLGSLLRILDIHKISMEEFFKGL